ncbi:MAG: hypothetical protein K0R99_2896 [Microbacterium sp.]|jgi:glycosyltransferase involved in cell wall biosynthesis|uniref:glycosyltransferase n=1 Tax=Microbacterium sp. TaxID=51671 RepID=UPI002613C822|nr:glycosyltransferase [Microbacterium sp.]MDF2561450.1 hypothetical protein [Microbacterium sp.]
MTGLLVHEWLERAGGSENVFEKISEAFPEAERWCLWNDAPERFSEVRETVLSRTPLRRSKAASLPLMPPVWRNLPRSDAEWILVSSHLFAHHARFRGAARHAEKFVYAHTPARYIWAPELDARGRSAVARVASRGLKPLDRRRAQEASRIAANSRFVADRIEDAWDRHATVIYPPVEVTEISKPQALTSAEEATLRQLPSDFVLGVSRFVPYKRLDAAIDLGRVNNMPVVLAGSGPEAAHLRDYGHRTHRGAVSIVDKPSTPLLRAIYARASVLAFAPVEDFGIIPVEAMAAGTPVIANAVGGAAESVQDGTSGALVHDWASHDELRSAFERAVLATPAACREVASGFDSAVFVRKIREFVRSEGGS